MSPKVDVADERRAQIMQAAMTCFARKGYHETTMDDIVAESGLSKGSLYWYFKSKKELFLSLLTVSLEELGSNLEETLADPSLSAADKLRYYCESVALIPKNTSSELIAIMVDLWAQTRHDDQVSRILVEIYQPYLEQLTALLEEGVAKEEFRPVKAAHLASLLIAAYDGLVLQVVVGLPIDTQEITATFLDVLLKGLRPE
jgi:AcrR family transcriptional regulator